MANKEIKDIILTFRVSKTQQKEINKIAKELQISRSKLILNKLLKDEQV